MKMQLDDAGVCLVAHAAVTRPTFLTDAIQVGSTDLHSSPSPSRPQSRFTRRSYSTGAIEHSAHSADPLQSLHALDARRRRQAETGQLLPRSAGKSSIDAPSLRLPRTASDPSDAFRSNDIVPESSVSAIPKELVRRPDHTGAPKLSREPAPRLRDGISYFNTATRIVNAGFEVLPAGSQDSTPIAQDWGAVQPGEAFRTSTESKRKRLQKQWRS